ncbi:MAG: hypothetical protein ACU0FT_08090 [Paracoccus sp. (in: a-proteobacteria)]|uniref:hypothetical protein n=1 Tax=Paracoccus sp. TaxID=267 RepID=UPI0040597724
MYLSPLPVSPMTAAERAGFRAACDMIRQEAERMRQASRQIGDGPSNALPADALEHRQKNQILELCAKAVDLCVDRTERHLPPALH